MKKLLFGTIVLALVSVFPIMTMAAVDIRIAIPLPPATPHRICGTSGCDRDA